MRRDERLKWANPSVETSLIGTGVKLLRAPQRSANERGLQSHKKRPADLYSFILYSNIVHNWDIRRPHSPSHLPELNFVRQGTAMAKITYQYFDANPGISKIGQTNHAIRSVDYGNTDGLRYSSPWPWIFALGISLTMWAFLGWVIWASMR
jgi:hypothetical protein